MLLMAAALMVGCTYLLLTSEWETPINFKSVETWVFGTDAFSIGTTAILLVLYQFCVMDMWQRCIAISGARKADGTVYSDAEMVALLKRKTFNNAVAPFVLLFGCWYLAGFTGLVLNISPDNTQLMLTGLTERIGSLGLLGVIGGALIVTGLIAAAVSTMDTFLIALAQTVMYDIYGSAVKPGLADSIDTRPDIDQYWFVNDGRSVVIVAGFFAVVFAFFQFNVLSFWTTMYSIMLPFFPAVWFAIRGRTKVRSESIALGSVVLGSLLALTFGVVGTFLVASPVLVNCGTILGLVVSVCGIYLSTESDSSSARI